MCYTQSASSHCIDGGRKVGRDHHHHLFKGRGYAKLLEWHIYKETDEGEKREEREEREEDQQTTQQLVDVCYFLLNIIESLGDDSQRGRCEIIPRIFILFLVSVSVSVSVHI